MRCWHRVLQCLSWQQLVSYFLTCLLLPITIASSIPAFFPYMTITVILCYLIIYAMVIHLTVFDNSSREWQIKRNRGAVARTFDSTLHSHVIEDDFCHICEIQVKPKTKHCRRCNICVEEFDHHCVWLNNCIGKHSYREFIILVAAVSVTSFYCAVGCLALLLCYLLRSPWLQHMHTPDPSTKCEDLLCEMRWLWLACTVISFVSYTALSLTTANLLFFHYRLKIRGMSTYDFLTKLKSSLQAAAQRNTHETATREDCVTRPSSASSLKVAALPTQLTSIFAASQSDKHRSKAGVRCASADGKECKDDARAVSSYSAPCQHSYA